LGQNFPNPYDGNTIIPYQLAEPAFVTLEIHDLLGRTIMKRKVGYRSDGKHRIEVDGMNLMTGTYFYSLQANEIFVRKSMTIVH